MRLPGSVSLEDLVSTGIVGLIKAVDKFDPTHNVKLRTYAEYKIRGAILDSLRGLDWASRDIRRKAKQIAVAISAVEQLVLRQPTEEEVAGQLALDLVTYRGWLLDVRGLTPSNLERSSDNEDNGRPLERVADRVEHWPSRLLEASELDRMLDEAMGRMPPVERIVLKLHYRQEMNLREIAQRLNLHISRISQLKSQAIHRMRTYLETRWPVPRGR